MFADSPNAREGFPRPKARSLFDAAPSGPPKPRFMAIAEAIDQVPPPQINK